MATYKSDKVDVMSSAESVYRRLSNPENLRTLLDNIPEGKISDSDREKLNQIRLTPDSIEITGGPVGSITLAADEMREPTLIRYAGRNTPVPMALQIDIAPLSASQSQVQVQIQLDVPMLLKPMINGPMQNLVSQVGVLLRHFPAE